jgi:hypothetical protein
MTRLKTTEQELAAVVVAWLEALDADVYQEVQVGGGVADIVARVGAEIWIVEVKTSLSLALIAQAMDRRRLAHRVLVAAPATRALRDVLPILVEVGIGLLEITPGETMYGAAIPPRSARATTRARWAAPPAMSATRPRASSCLR